MLEALSSPDRLSVKPALLALVVVAGLALACALPGAVSFFLIPLSLLAYALGAVVILTITVVCLLRKRPRRTASALLILVLPVLLWRPILRAVDVVHLGLSVGFGVGQLGATSKSEDGSLVFYDWSVGLAGGPNTFLVHDPTDEVTLPLSQNTHPLRGEDNLEEECAGKVEHLLGHYYLCTF